jgi:microcystin-dependent protein
MSDQYVGEIRIFGGGYAPEGWHLCDGASLQINAYPALFALIGTTYGGDGKGTFKLPDLMGRLPIGQGAGNNLTARVIGASGGSETVRLTLAETPEHGHPVKASSSTGKQVSPKNGVWASLAGGNSFAVWDGTKTKAMNAKAILPSEGIGMAHENMMPVLILTFIIALTGEYPRQG